MSRELTQVEKMFVIALDYFKDEKNKTMVSIGTRHAQTMDQTILLGGRIEFNSFIHRRDAWDIMGKYNLYYKKLPDGRYEAGSHDENDNVCVVDERATVAVSEKAYQVIKLCLKTSSF